MSDKTITTRKELFELDNIQLVTMLSEGNIVTNRIYAHRLEEILNKYSIKIDINLESSILLKVDADFMYLSVIFKGPNSIKIELEDLTKEELIDIIYMVCEETNTSFLVSYDGITFECDVE